MAEFVYATCALTSLFCAGLLVWNYRRRRLALALWTSACFIGLAINNLLLFVDLIVVREVDLSIVRSVTAVLALLALVVGLIWETP